MALPSIIGHLEARNRLREALRSGRLPQVLCISGPVGVGKHAWLSWLLWRCACERREPEPCGHCRACRLVQGLAYPDLHWFVPIPRPEGGGSGEGGGGGGPGHRRGDGGRRARPLYGQPDGMASHSMASVRLVHQQAALTAVESSGRIFILGDAERLVPADRVRKQANALLKLLEEPPVGALFILTVVDPRRLLPGPGRGRCRCASMG